MDDDARGDDDARDELERKIRWARVTRERIRVWTRARRRGGRRDVPERWCRSFSTFSSSRSTARTGTRRRAGAGRGGGERGVRAAVLDGHSAWWAVASPLFALSVGPYLVFLKRLNDAESATGEMRRAFATLLLFVLVSIPAEAYTKSAYGEVLSNIDALHFLIQSAISLTNLRILLAFRDVNTEREDETSTRVDAGRPGKVVEAFAGVGLLATALLLSLDARLLVVPDGSPRGVGDVGGGVKIVGGRFRERDERVHRIAESAGARR